MEGEGGGCGWRGEAARRRPAAGPLRPKPHPAPRPKPPNAPHPRPSVPRLTPSLRLASAPAMSSASTQGARPLEAARCNAVLFCCGGAAAGHTHAVERRRQAGRWCLKAAGEARRGLGGGWRGGAHVVCGLKVGTLGDEELEAVDLACSHRTHKGRPAVLCGGATAAPHAVSVGGEGGAAGAAGGDGGGREAEEVGRGWRGGAHVVCGLEIGTLGDEVLETVKASVVHWCRRIHKGRPAVLCGGATAAPHAVSVGGEGGAAGAAGGEGGGRGAEEGGTRPAGRRSRCLWPRDWHPW